MKKLKLLLILLFGLIGLSSFCSAGSLIYTGHYEFNYDGTSLPSNTRLFSVGYSNVIGANINDISLNCELSNVNNKPSMSPFVYTLTENGYFLSSTSYGSISFPYNRTFSGGTIVFLIRTDMATSKSFSFDWTCTISSENIIETTANQCSITIKRKMNDYQADSVQTYTGTDNWFVEIDTRYNQQFYYPDDYTFNFRLLNTQNVILKSDVNTGYCESNNLCPVCDYSSYESQISSLSGSLNSCQNSLGASSTSLASCQNSLNSCLSANCPSVGVSRSSLFINDIQHLGASSIYMSIPEEISWDYSYSNSGEIMEIDVEGYNVDYDYINGVVNVQKYKPSSEDFTQVVGILAPYMKIFLFLLFIFIVIKWIKKPFRSKLK